MLRVQSFEDCSLQWHENSRQQCAFGNYSVFWALPRCLLALAIRSFVEACRAKLELKVQEVAKEDAESRNEPRKEQQKHKGTNETGATSLSKQGLEKYCVA